MSSHNPESLATLARMIERGYLKIEYDDRGVEVVHRLNRPSDDEPTLQLIYDMVEILESIKELEKGFE